MKIHIATGQAVLITKHIQEKRITAAVYCGERMAEFQALRASAAIPN